MNSKFFFLIRCLIFFFLLFSFPLPAESWYWWLDDDFNMGSGRQIIYENSKNKLQDKTPSTDSSQEPAQDVPSHHPSQEAPQAQEEVPAPSTSLPKKKSQPTQTSPRVGFYTDVRSFLEHKGFSFSYSNDNLSYEGVSDNHIRVYIDDVLATDRNWGWFDWSTLNMSLVDRIEIDPNTPYGICMYIYTKTTEGARFTLYSKSFRDSVNDTFGASLAAGKTFSFGVGDKASTLAVRADASWQDSAGNFGTHAARPFLGWIPYTDKREGFDATLMTAGFRSDWSSACLDASLSYNLTNEEAYNKSRFQGKYFHIDKTTIERHSLAASAVSNFQDFSIALKPTFSYVDVTNMVTSGNWSQVDTWPIFDMHIPVHLAYCGLGVTYSPSFAWTDSLEGFDPKAPTFVQGHDLLFTYQSSFDMDASIGFISYFHTKPIFDWVGTLSYTPTFNDFKLTFLANKFAFPPTFQQMWWKDSPPDLPVTSGYRFSVGLSWQNYVSGEMYFGRNYDKVKWLAEKNRFGSAGGSLVYGGKLALSTANRFNYVVLGADYHWQNGVFYKAVSGKDFDPIPNIPNHTVSTYAQFSYAGLEISPSLLWHSPVNLDFENWRKSLSRFQVDLALSYSFSDLNLSLVMCNLLDATFIGYQDQVYEPFSIKASVSITM